ncbi:hypothetical protein JAAARDRAFT_457972 [Jaapia argillacea MUCL 33604]|uniref:Uncharacterized protein n=1 Tax=Jaapia argillacea MUCL 33604 TaxID=933084 RepID=A0A067Q5U3_9AGAM|nr:hypothetical protein JAAARDRAFT_457972 [Jaapia argillacea MUCL 33604]
MLRVWALYGRSRRVFLLSLICYLVDIAAGLVAAGVAMASQHTLPQTPVKSIWIVSLGWGVHVVVNAIYFGLTLYKFVTSIPLAGLTSRESCKLAPLLRLFIRDGTVYFLIILGECEYSFAERISVCP